MIKLVRNEFVKSRISKLLFSQILFLIVVYVIHKYSNKYLLDSIYNLIPFIGIMICILFSGTICGELESGTFRFYLTKPYKRWKIFLSKYLCIFIYLSITILIINILSFIIVGKFDINHLKTYYLYNIPNYFIISFVLYLSVKLKSQSLCVGISIFVLSFSLIISQVLFGYSINYIEYTFLPYLDYSIFKDKISLNNMNSELNTNLSLNRGIIIDFIYMILFYLIGNYKFNKKDIKS